MITRFVKLASALTVVVGAALAAPSAASAMSIPTVLAPAPASVEQVQYGWHSGGWYPGKGARFCRRHPGNWRCNRGYYRRW